ncbi:hypothetical protein [Yersinia pestis]|uniref:hypothetical protein n=1 Tax=Yersinia pestis TaxID=632 RepID=UPI001EE4531E|nr:hypothetical protein [Yersinia pestis]
MVAKGLLAGQPAALQLQIRFTNSYQLTGTIAALAAHHVLCTHRVGLYWLTDLLPIKVLLSQLNALALFSHFHIHCQLDNNAVNFQEGHYDPTSKNRGLRHFIWAGLSLRL